MDSINFRPSSHLEIYQSTDIKLKKKTVRTIENNIEVNSDYLYAVD